ncbi:MAG: FAD-binding oxidoreductase [Mucilaginibacter sp.]|uniref:FAD-binding oxidoreductase n=1 Tax=Mucilaginibacter sp. TaxID=1882438 RepID=UPI0034E5E5A6
MKHYTLKITELRRETADTLTVVFKQPALKKIKYQAGQYLTLILKINGRRYSRPYSFSSAPGVDSDLEITVKQVPGGIVSNHIADRLKTGDLVEVMEPMGSFVLNPDSITTDTHLVLWGAGSGITPLFSIIKEALHKNTGKKVTLVYGNRSLESVIFKDKIKALKTVYPNFTSWNSHTKLAISEVNPTVIEGRIDPAKVLSVMQAEGDLNHTLHYICGPVGLKESVKTALLALGVKSQSIQTEDFEIVRDPVAFENISTRMVTVIKDGVKHLVEVVKGKSILEAGLDAMLNLSYSCQTGNCLVCKAVLVQGEVKMIGPTNKPEELNADECLLCCSFPMVENVEVAVA